MATPQNDSYSTTGRNIYAGRWEVFADIPNISFTQGVPGTHDLSQYVTIPSGYVLNRYDLLQDLPSCLSFNTATGLLSYDGSAVSVALTGLRVRVLAQTESTPVTQFSLTSTSSASNTPWTIGHFFKEGDVPAGSSVIADVPYFQAVVRNRWPDGSVKFAVLSGQCDLIATTARTVQLSSGTSTSGTAVQLSALVAANPSIVASVAGFGTVSPTLSSPYKQLLSGPVCSEWQYRTAIDAQLVAWFYIRLYANGTIDVMCSIENLCVLSYTGAINKVGRVSLTIDGYPVYDSITDLDIKHHTRIVLHNGAHGWHRAGTSIGRVPTVAHNPTYLQRTGAVPAYQATSISSTLLDGLAQAYTPYAQHNLPGNSLGGGGDSPSIGWMSRWDASYIVSADARAYRAVLVNSFAAGAWSVHYRNPTTHGVSAYADAPTTGVGLSAGSNSAYGGRAYYSGQYGTDWDISHAWLPGYMAYVLTGDWWHLESLQFFVKWVHYTSNVSYRGNATGLVVRNLQPRGTAWALRNLACAACVTPDDDTERAAYCNALGASFTWMRGYHTNALGLFTEPDQVGWGDPGGQRTWMSDYVVGAIGIALDMKLLSGQQLTDGNALMNWCGAGLVQRMSDGSNPNGWHWSCSNVYSPVVSTYPFPQNQQQANFDANWGIAFARHFGRATGTDLDTTSIKIGVGSDNVLANHTGSTASSFGVSYTATAMSALAVCANRGVAGAAAAYSRFTSASNYNTCLAALSSEPRFGLGVRT